ncbi:MAG: hypothetical protein QN152_05075 [Armatimonadota bacterium]|nr:hypothetical protein [Armatimonadota bacterium]MDR7427642.1 hypothetical protein [Armatimonadota bacterium]MDR7464301.1 hypothetical protein [Armatimonadota bacterium]MDR7470949.1 hypothetical protein [Armatimonadota bacterium]MDR7473589.1 hypothetical protein [Armatimonadota bacterium]
MVALMLPLLLVAAGLAVFLPVPVDAGARLVQHLLSLTLQVLAAAAATTALLRAARTYGPRDRERRVWHLAAWAPGVWVVGLLVYALREWSGPARLYPSAADAFQVTAFLLLLAALGDEFLLVSPMLPSWQRLALAGCGALLGVTLVGWFMWPVLSSPLHPLEKGLDLFYAGMPALLVPLALGPAIAFRGGVSGYVWLGVAAGVACLALAGPGLAYLASYELYTHVHPVNLLRVTGLAALSASGTWHRRMIEAL